MLQKQQTMRNETVESGGRTYKLQGAALFWPSEGTISSGSPDDALALRGTESYKELMNRAEAGKREGFGGGHYSAVTKDAEGVAHGRVLWTYNAN